MWRRPRDQGPRTWPLRLEGTTPHGERIVLRALRATDEASYIALRRANAEWLAPWDATAPHPSVRPRRFADLVAAQEVEARAGRALPMAVEHAGRLVGQVNVSNIARGSFWSCTVGYWVSRAMAGRGVIPTAVALVGDHCFETLGLHRIEINIRPENLASLAIVRKLGFRDEGMRERYLHIDGEWRDHRSFALTTEDLADERLMERLTQSSQQSLWRHTDPSPTA
ncbi:MAG: GNAT family N-acetyltransferase [Actinobacteria bacterium]|jgi:ribosomal-protein-alanine N-acetyltransferase|nr:GNAT family N-acetyltransferase [Actinomycetota bacterium]